MNPTPNQITECIDEQYAIKTKKGSVIILKGTRCSESECREYGCAFPDCAILGEMFSSEDEARKEIPNLKIV